MAQIKPDNPRYRTKEEIANDIAFILTAPVSYGTKYAVLNEVMWVWTEFQGKYEGCTYWTPLAFAKYTANRKHKRTPSDGLRHEHIVPKSVVIKLLCALETPTPQAVYDICDKFLIGVVVTVEEDAFLNEFRMSMPPEFHDPSSSEHQDPWLRYKRCNIKWTSEHVLRQALSAAFPDPKM